MRIYTVTLNPAYDIHADAAELMLRHENLAAVRSREAGGKGVNISRALHSAGVRNTAIIVLGTENGGEFRRALTELDCLYFERPGRIRENLTIHTADGRETRISFTGFSVDASILTEIAKVIQADSDTVVTFTGRVPDGVPLEAAKMFLLDLKARGAKIVLDSKSFSLKDICQVKPWLIKPNQEEIGAFFGCGVETMAQAAERAGEFAACGVENVMVSMGEQGALLISGGRLYTAVPPEIRAVSTIGAGDSSLAGFLAAFAAGEGAEGCLRSAVAFGTAACLTEGSQPPRQTDIRRIREQIR